MFSTKSVNAQIVRFLQTGRTLTIDQAQRRFGIVNVRARMSEIRAAGYPLSRQRRTRVGVTSNYYRIAATA